MTEDIEVAIRAEGNTIRYRQPSVAAGWNEVVDVGSGCAAIALDAANNVKLP
jgi:hypothetical protein